MNALAWQKFPHEESERQDVISKQGVVIFNYIQQRVVDKSVRPETPVELAGTTDPIESGFAKGG